jgi:type II secretory pathway pseudopilin PulG
MRLKKRNGFSILAIILVIVAVIVAIGVWALSGTSNTSSASSSTSDIQVSALMNDTSAIKLAFDELIINGASDTSIVFVPNALSTPQAPNVLDTVNGIAMPRPSSKMIRDDATEPNGIYVYSKTFATGSQYKKAILLAGLKDSVCSGINKSLNGDANIPKYGSINDSQGFVTGATASNPNSNVVIDFSSNGLSAFSGWTIGCIAGAGASDNNMFFRVLK